MTGAPRRLRSREWFDIPGDPSATATHIERYTNFGISAAELRSGNPIIGIAQTGSDLVPCNRIHVDLIPRIRDGIREAGGIALEFPVHPIQESGKRPTAALDRNLQYLSLVEVLFGYPLDGVVLTTGCDKTTPAMLMGAATVDIPAIALSGGPMLNGYWRGKLAGSGTILWEARKLLAEGEIDDEEFIQLVADATPSPGHCNTMGTATTMNSLAEALGMSLPGSTAIPAPHKERAETAYKTGRRIVEMVEEDLTPSKILTREAFENAIVVNSAIGGSTNAPIHLNAIARHANVELDISDWETVGLAVPLLVNLQPAGEYLGEAYHQAGGVPAVMHELLKAGKLHGSSMTVAGSTVEENCANSPSLNPDVIRLYANPMMENAGFVVLKGNVCDAAIMKISVISDEFRQRYLSEPGQENVFEVRAIVFEGPEDYHKRINDPALKVDAHCILVIRGCGPVGYPGSAEVVNMQPPDALIREGIRELPTLGDGRQSGTSGSPSILNASPESAIGGGLALLETGDTLKIDLNQGTLDVLIPDEELATRAAVLENRIPEHQTPWQEIYRDTVGQLSSGGIIELATKYQKLRNIIPRHSH
ncbi:MAG TPA: dihydroxy-acid dehydratase [Gammaproteobacteria bacterium]|jgi:dihydroxy-acid dehydratase|nr:dihydroxy-acid dehydratase [Gammaproteobacteria bacterium]HIA40728.1 dihydroxy-acid dehydratase [Gammaproteobacteria bacterium]HIB07493.1 dihydroxy-acid dehydratase [Gammaproteobacteria bacterium]HIB82540.1 dihydroxy-acid dehydratase [Gammaproteobacteria bacterium]HIM87371.1 dihydroxy-acid dehydratase [Gammaproteobacteria bacterium]